MYILFAYIHYLIIISPAELFGRYYFSNYVNETLSNYLAVIIFRVKKILREIILPADLWGVVKIAAWRVRSCYYMRLKADSMSYRMNIGLSGRFEGVLEIRASKS